MHKFTGLNIDRLLNAEVSEVAFAMYNLAFRFNNNHWINIEGRFKLTGPNGQLEEGDAQEHKPVSSAHQLLDAKLLKYSVPNANQLDLDFSNGTQLTIYNDTDMYECCSISPNIYI